METRLAGQGGVGAGAGGAAGRGGLDFGGPSDQHFLFSEALKTHPGQDPAATVERLAWLKSVGCRPTNNAPDAAVECGNLPGLLWLLGEGVPPDQGYINSSLRRAAQGGRLDILLAIREAMHEAFTPLLWSSIVSGALEGARPNVLQWAADCLTPEELLNALQWAGSEAVSSGCVQTLRWALDHGVTLTEDAWIAAVMAGSEPAVDLLAEAGCPKSRMGEPYDHAIECGEWQLLPALHRAGVPLGPLWRALCAACQRHGAPAAVLRWLEAETGVDPRVVVVATYEAEEEEEEEARAWGEREMQAVEAAGCTQDGAWTQVERRRQKREGERRWERLRRPGKGRGR
ncbi:hypothetical protein HYH03_014971 [Edaphochlamys debaryana]|uniref:Ankyrin repeat domain-containing protein n=1 Tax=Edaphochlamys debaryana TaxID=47281 RepID=A0A835XLR7_9CHLO|nr:hypothetical protein HYH03_014971 [Edaphochlamys debaryana]|eukprot:KAG2486393.1 hypothetical protein HYH03_014971 [Edaphochlamys debaryana]